jgi:hypothetical protein
MTNALSLNVSNKIYTTPDNRAKIKTVLDFAANNITHHTQKEKAIYAVNFGRVRVAFAMEILPQGLCRKMMVAKAPSFFQSLLGRSGGPPPVEDLNQILELFEFKGRLAASHIEKDSDILMIVEPILNAPNP